MDAHKAINRKKISFDLRGPRVLTLENKMKVHILGSGQLGYLIAHCLKSASPKLDITLHFHRLRLAEELNAVYGITLVTPGGGSVFHDGFGYEMKDERMRRSVPFIPHILERHARGRKEYIPTVAADKIRPLPDGANNPPRLEGGESGKDSIIEVLIVALKPIQTMKHLESVAHRLRRNSTIVLLHNGMNLLNQVQEGWSEEERPHILEGFSTHGISKRAWFTVDHWGMGNIHMAIAPRLDESDIFSYQSLRQNKQEEVINRYHVNDDIRLQLLTKQEKYASLIFIIKQLLRSRSLNCTLRAYLPNFYLMQLRRTILQSILQILGTIQRATSVEVIEEKSNHKLIGKLLKEILPVLELDPLISSNKTYLQQFSHRQLYAQSRYMALSSSGQMNALLQDVLGNRETELQLYSGYLLRLASLRNIKMPTWRVLHQLVLTLHSMEQERHNKFAPTRKDGRVKDLPEWTSGVDERYWKVDRVEERGEVRRRHAFEEFDMEEDDDEKTEEERSGNESAASVIPPEIETDEIREEWTLPDPRARTRPNSHQDGRDMTMEGELPVDTADQHPRLSAKLRLAADDEESIAERQVERERKLVPVLVSETVTNVNVAAAATEFPQSDSYDSANPKDHHRLSKTAKDAISDDDRTIQREEDPTKGVPEVDLDNDTRIMSQPETETDGREGVEVVAHPPPGEPVKKKRGRPKGSKKEK